jgi:inosine-uridine nucleoside N-ribohydrolase
MGADDWMAILYLLARPDVRVRAITVSGTGLAHCGPGVRNARELLALAGKRAPVACGRERPLRGGRTFPRAWRRDADTLLGLTLPQAGGSGAREAAASELLASTVRAAAPRTISLLTLGPLTNVAGAFARHPDLPDRLAAVSVMGGALAAPGNAPGGRAEWNVAADPAAASAVLGSGAPITLVPLDATNEVPIGRSFYEGLRTARRTPAARFVFDVLTRQRDAIDAGGAFFWDPLAAVVLTDDVASLERRRVHLATRGALAGWTAVASDGADVRVAGHIDRARFDRLFLSTLASRPKTH